ncbi:unnamed protein product [Musa acuminata subsp. malaccensis]|uniref:(wild Malaysian banana) hypothetical protein n=1 Tax=Musa acuminata subsp. malaccensis TaxID=214687 RepID=A0A804KKC1_MUSAM|nr:unnamed protein product [Musa acuminata subsp. malaccensis]
MVVEALLSSFLEILIDSTKKSVVRQIGAVWGLEEDLEKLGRTLLRIQSIVGDAEEQQIKDTAVKKWLTALRDAAYAAEDVLDEFNLEILRKSNRAIENKMMGKVSDFFSSHNALYFRFKMARKLNEVVKSIDEIAAESRKFNFAVRTQEQTPPTVRQTHSYVVESDVIGRGEEKDEIVKLLIEQRDENEKIAVLPIVGMGGLGKTTLAQLIYQDKRVERHFQLRIWVCVGSVFDLGEILKAIISSATGRQSDLKFMDMLQCSVRDVLAGKRYLLVLDDEWNEDSSKWDDLKALLACGGDGSRVVVTTRSDGVSSMMGTLTTHKLAFLSEEDSWDLFRRRAFPSGQDDDKQQHQNLVEIGKAIVTKCGGLPLAVKALGSMLSYQNDEREWSAIKESNIWDTKVGEGDILPALLLSYNDLPSHLKRCFAFCAIFPKDYEIEVDMLIRLWMAQGFIPSEGTAEPGSYLDFWGNIMHAYFRWRDHELEVKGYCNLRTCKMHDLIHDLAQHISGEEGVALLEPCTATAPRKDVHHLSLPGTSSSSKIHETLGKFPALRTLLVRDAYYGKAVDNISRPAKLRVLGFHNLNATMLQNLARHLKHVRFLDISYSTIPELPEAITTLLNLQTLKLSGCQLLRKLPSKMKNMSNLRHLYLDECPELRDMPEGLGRLSCLHTLSKYIVGVGAGRGIGQLKELNLSGKLEIYGLGNVRNAANAREANLHSKRDLHSLALCWGVVDWTEEESLSENVETRDENSEALLKALAPPDGIKVLSIWGYGGVRFPTWTSDEQLLSRYQLLVEIHLGGCRNCQHLPSEQTFPALKRLGKCFPHLVELRISECSKLGSMPRLPSLKVLGMPSGNRMLLGSIENLSTLAVLCINTDSVTVDGETRSTFPRLRRLYTSDCDWLFSSRQSMFWKSLVSLHTLTIDSCEDLRTFPEEFQGLKSLKSLFVIDYLCIYKCGGLKKMPRCPTSLKRLNILYCIGLTSLTEDIGQLTSLESLFLDDCPNLLSLPLELQQLTMLHRVHIEDCLKLKSLPQDLWQYLSGLQSFTILKCPILEKQLRKKKKEGRHLVSRIPESTIMEGSKAFSFN